MLKRKLTFFAKGETPCHWAPREETGDWAEDGRIGRNYADELIRECPMDSLPAVLARIVEAIGEKGRYEAIEIGFITRIGEIAAQGVARGGSAANDA